MPFQLICEIFTVETYTGKSGLGCNVTLLNQSEKGKLEINTGNANLIQELVKNEGKEVLLNLKLSQNKFGVRIELVSIVTKEDVAA